MIGDLFALQPEFFRGPGQWHANSKRTIYEQYTNTAD